MKAVFLPNSDVLVPVILPLGFLLLAKEVMQGRREQLMHLSVAKVVPDSRFFLHQKIGLAQKIVTHLQRRLVTASEGDEIAALLA
jgi:hypothetical protein